MQEASIRLPGRAASTRPLKSRKGQAGQVPEEDRHAERMGRSLERGAALDSHRRAK